jgi:hypothetical protein
MGSVCGDCALIWLELVVVVDASLESAAQRCNALDVRRSLAGLL